MTKDSNKNGRITYRDCFDFQTKIHEGMQQMEERLMQRIDKLDGNQRASDRKIYTVSGIVAVLLSLLVSLFTKS